MGKVEQQINSFLQRYPSVKKYVKRGYQLIMYACSKKIKFEGEFHRITPLDEYEYFFGYYDKSPWDSLGRYVLCNRVRNAYSKPDNDDEAQLVLIDTQNGNNLSIIATTRAWNVQQGCMLQWLGPNYETTVIYNDFLDGKLCSVILDIKTGESRKLSMPVYSVASDGSFALTLDFTRLHRMRPGYGYCNIAEVTANEKCPNSPCIWRVDLGTGVSTPLFNYTDFIEFEPKPTMKGAEHKVNHLMISPDGSRFMVLHRWFVGERKYTRLLTGSTNGGELYNLLDDDFVSHCFWKNNQEIITYAEKKGQGRGYFLLKDKTEKYQRLWPFLIGDGHPSYGPEGRVVTDTYPDKRRLGSVYILHEQQKDALPIVRVYAPFKYDNDVRCDLHPRWDRKGEQVCFDGVFEGKREVYVIPLDDIEKKKKRIRTMICLRRCVNKGPVHQTYNILNNLNLECIEPVFMTVKKEDPSDSVYKKYKHLNIEKHVVDGSTLDLVKGIVFGKGKIVSEMVKQKPEIVHTTGILLDLLGYRVAKKLNIPQVVSVRNYAPEDYTKKFGRIKGTFIAQIHLAMMRHLRSRCEFVCCSQSLADEYRKNNGITMRYIRNGVDVEKFNPDSIGSKEECRKQLGLDKESFIYITVAQVISRKNIEETIEAIPAEFNGKKTLFVLVGDGSDLERLKKKYSDRKNILWAGKKSEVSPWLKAADIFVSSSESEGLPNSVIEAMAMGLPVILSDIIQHQELIKLDPEIGYLYKLHSLKDLKDKLMMVDDNFIRKAGEKGKLLASGELSDRRMASEYQELYWELKF